MVQVTVPLTARDGRSAHSRYLHTIVSEQEGTHTHTATVSVPGVESSRVESRPVSPRCCPLL